MKTIIGFLIKILVFFTPKQFHRFINYETISYLFFGGLTTMVGLGSYWLFIFYLEMGIATANNISNVLAIIFAFFVNKMFVFRSPGWRPRILVPELVKFGASRAFTSVVETLVLMLLVDWLGLHAMLMKLLTMVFIQVIGNYVLGKWVVFTRRRRDKNE